MKSAFLLATTLWVGVVTAFTTPSVQLLPLQQQQRGSARTTTSALDAVIDIGSEDAFDKTIKKATGLVVVDYSTTWCGPCKGVCVYLYLCILLGGTLGHCFIQKTCMSIHHIIDSVLTLSNVDTMSLFENAHSDCPQIRRTL